MARHKVEESTYQLQVPVNQQELGRLIGQAGTDWRRMGLSFLVRWPSWRWPRWSSSARAILTSLT